MTNSNKTLIVGVIDRSGSMGSCRQPMQNAWNGYINEQKNVPGECEVTLAIFDNEYEIVYSYVDIQSAPPFELIPRGYTALHDAIGKTINDAGQHLSNIAEDQRPGNVLFVIVTDGLENASREFDRKQIEQMIQHQQDIYGWVFTYLGANQDAVLVGQGLGISRDTSMTYDSTSDVAMASTGSTLSVQTTLLRGTGKFKGYSEEDRKKSKGQ